MRENSFPSSPMSFIGREVELGEISNLLTAPGCRLLTLVGPGGVGKTRLLMEATQVFASKGAFSNGVYFVPLQPITSSEFMVSAIADSLKLSFYGEQHPRTQLLDFLSEKHLLLALDNMEHLLDGVDLLPEILATAPKVTIVVTSRERLRLREEWVLEVGGLPFPDQNTDTAYDYNAVQLFVESARRAGYAPVEADFAAITHICQLTEGIPLAIELAAVWVRAMPCTRIASEIEHNLDILTTTTRNVPEQHRSMRAVFEHSLRLLSPEEQSVFRKMSVFRGGFTREAAEEVAGTSLASLLTLVDKSMLRVDAAGRYDLHELMRQYGEDQLAKAGEAEAAKDAHSAYFATYLEERWEDLKGRRYIAASNEIAADFDNVRAAWMHMVEQHKAVELHKAASSLWRFSDTNCPKHESFELFSRAIECLSSVDNDDQHERALGHLLARQGWCYVTLGTDEMHRKGKAAAEEGLAILRRVGSPEEICMALETLSFANRFLEQLIEAQHMAEEALEIGRETNNTWCIARGLFWLGVAYQCQRNMAEAKRIFQECYHYSSLAGDIWCMASTCGQQVAWIDFDEGQYQEAKLSSLRGLRLYEEINNRWGVMESTLLLMRIALGQGNVDEAKLYCQRTVKAAYDIGAVPDILARTQDSADIFLGLGQKERALEILSMVAVHPLTHSRHKNSLEQKRTALQGELSPTAYTAAVERGKTLKLEAVVADLLDTLGDKRAASALASNHPARTPSANGNSKSCA